MLSCIYNRFSRYCVRHGIGQKDQCTFVELGNAAKFILAKLILAKYILAKFVLAKFILTKFILAKFFLAKFILVKFISS